MQPTLETEAVPETADTVVPPSSPSSPLPADLSIFLNAVEAAPGDAWDGLQAGARAVGCLVSVESTPAKGPISLPSPDKVDKREWIRRRRKLLSMLPVQTLIIDDPAGRSAKQWQDWCQRAAALQLQRGTPGAGAICYAPDVAADGCWYRVKIGNRCFPYQLQRSYTSKLNQYVSRKDGPEVPATDRRRIERLVDWEDVVGKFWELILAYPVHGPYPFSLHVSFRLPKRVATFVKSLKMGKRLYPLGDETTIDPSGRESLFREEERLDRLAQQSSGTAPTKHGGKWVHSARGEFDEDAASSSVEQRLLQDPESLWERLLNLATDDAPKKFASGAREAQTADRKRAILAMTRDALYQSPPATETAGDYRHWLKRINSVIAKILGISEWTVRRVRRELFAQLVALEEEHTEPVLSLEALVALEQQGTLLPGQRKPCMKCGGFLREEAAVATCFNCGSLWFLKLSSKEHRARMEFQMGVDSVLAPKFHYARNAPEDDSRMSNERVRQEITKILTRTDRSAVQKDDWGRSYE